MGVGIDLADKIPRDWRSRSPAQFVPDGARGQTLGFLEKGEPAEPVAAFLEPAALIARAEETGDGFGRLALFEEAQGLPSGAVWNELCRRTGAPIARDFIGDVDSYAKSALAARG